MRPPVEACVMITGASSGIGEAFARLAAQSAQRVVLVARRADRLHQLAATLRAARPGLDVHVLPCDLGDRAQVAALIEASAPLEVDVLVNNAGLGDLRLFEDATPGKLEQMIDVNVTALTLLTHGLLPGMLRKGRGGILNVSSGYGLTWTPGAAAYSGTKHYVNALTESLRCELRPRGIVVTQVCPGPVHTEFSDVAGLAEGEAPRFLMQSAEACAEQAWRGFLADRALVVPGWAAWAVISAGRLTPAWMFRLMGAVVTAWLRRIGPRPG
jgi:short-subunit dehydrogenase